MAQKKQTNSVDTHNANFEYINLLTDNSPKAYGEYDEEAEILNEVIKKRAY